MPVTFQEKDTSEPLPASSSGHGEATPEDILAREPNPSMQE